MNYFYAVFIRVFPLFQYQYFVVCLKAPRPPMHNVPSGHLQHDKGKNIFFVDIPECVLKLRTHLLTYTLNFSTRSVFETCVWCQSFTFQKSMSINTLIKPLITTCWKWFPKAWLIICCVVSSRLIGFLAQIFDSKESTSTFSPRLCFARHSRIKWCKLAFLDVSLGIWAETIAEYEHGEGQ